MIAADLDDLAAPLLRWTRSGAHVVVETPLQLPDGDVVAVYLLVHSDPVLIVDRGATLRWLQSHSSSEQTSERLGRTVSDACDGLGVVRIGSELRTSPRPGEPLAHAVMRLAQACVRVAEGWRNIRSRQTATFVDDVEAWFATQLAATPWVMTRNDHVAGISATSWTVDLRLRGSACQRLIFIVACDRRDQVRKLAEHVVAACTDLAHLRKLRRAPVSFAVVFHDEGPAFTDAETRLVAPFATPLTWTTRTSWLPQLLAETEALDEEDEPVDEAVTETVTEHEAAAETMHVRRAEATDYAAFARLMPELGTGDPVPTEDHWQAHQQATTLIGFVGGEAVAYAYFDILADWGYVRNVVVTQQWRGRGLGHQLMHEVENFLQMHGCSQWCLNVQPDNAAAVQLYARHGLVPAYHAYALRFPWSAVAPPWPEAPEIASAEVATFPLQPAEDAAVETRFGLPHGQLASRRSQPGRLLFRLGRADASEGPVLGVAMFDPMFPGAFPFRVASSALAFPLLAALQTYASPEFDFMQVVVEDDEPLAEELVARGAEVRFRMLHLRGRVGASD